MVSIHMPSGVPVLRFSQNGSQAYEVDAFVQTFLKSLRGLTGGKRPLSKIRAFALNALRRPPQNEGMKWFRREY